MEANSLLGNFFDAWGSPTKKQTVNDFSTNNMTLLNNDIYLQAISKLRLRRILNTTWNDLHYNDCQTYHLIL